jgi:hypothetical protein
MLSSSRYLTFHPRGVEEADFASVYLHVELPSSIKEIEIKARISFINHGVHKFGRIFHHKFNEQSTKVEFKYFCQIGDFIDDDQFESVLLDCKARIFS